MGSMMVIHTFKNTYIVFPTEFTRARNLVALGVIIFMFMFINPGGHIYMYVCRSIKFSIYTCAYLRLSKDIYIYIYIYKFYTTTIYIHVHHKNTTHVYLKHSNMQHFTPKHPPVHTHSTHGFHFYFSAS